MDKKLLMKMPAPYNEGKVRNWVATFPPDSILSDWDVAGHGVRPSITIPDETIINNCTWVLPNWDWNPINLKFTNTKGIEIAVIEDWLSNFRNTFAYMLELVDENNTTLESWELTYGKLTNIVFDDMASDGIVREIELTVTPSRVVLHDEK